MNWLKNKLDEILILDNGTVSLISEPNSGFTEQLLHELNLSLSNTETIDVQTEYKFLSTCLSHSINKKDMGVIDIENSLLEIFGYSDKKTEIIKFDENVLMQIGEYNKNATGMLLRQRGKPYYHLATCFYLLALYFSITDECKNSLYAYRKAVNLENEASNLGGTKFLKSHNARIMAKAKYTNNPKQKIKTQIKELWTEWQTLENPKERYTSTAKFCADMMDKFHDPADKDTPQSQAVIERWCRYWRKEQNNTHPA